MGGGSGGGGGFFGGGRVEPVSSSRTEAEKQLLAAQVNSDLRAALGAINDRDIETIGGYIEQIKTSLGSALSGSVDMIFGGSVAKHTYVNGLSDVDSLLIIDRSHLDRSSPKELLSMFCKTLEDELPNAIVDRISLGILAATVRFQDGTEIQILPACKDGDSVRIPDSLGIGWQTIRPQEFAKRLSDVNSRMNGAVVPVVKLAKSAIDQLPKAHRLSGYHVEALAVEIFSVYAGSTSYRDMTVEFFKTASERVLSPIADVTGQSPSVDESLGPSGSLERLRVSDAFARVARKLDTASTVEVWKSTLGMV